MNPIYLDHAATTRVRSEVFEAMRPLLTEQFGNPSSVHRWGRQARALLEEARERVAAALGARRSEIYFTSGGTEADNLAILGAARAQAGGRVVISAIEHKAVLAAAKQAAHEGAELVFVAVDENGRVDLDALSHALADAGDRSVVSVMWGNNEVGTLQPVAEIAQMCRAGARFHTDAVQAFGRERVRMDEVDCELLSISGHKIGAPKGIGALFVRSGSAALAPLVHGGGQERELRPGTENIAAAVGFGIAAELAAAEQQSEAARLREFRDRLETMFRSIDGVRINAENAPRLPHVSNVSIAGVDQEAVLVSLDLEGIAVSSGSACQSGSVDPSHVLLAMNAIRDHEASIRCSLGRSTTNSEIDQVIERMPRVLKRLRHFAEAGR